ncbi:MAG: DUF411 domain-containing protein [Alphaproteobacteria bacterium]|nr:DUF411 domain-containing protein [Alphaproteobacteria bacterium]
MFDRRQMLMTAAAFAALAPGCTAATGLAIKVYKDPSCGCCTAWVDHLNANGFSATVDESADMAAIKAKLGVPDDLTSCHTGLINGYAIEGHVPADDIKRLLKEKPKAAGIAVPGMPVNSPGMEVEGQPDERYTVWLFTKGGARSAFAAHGA